MTERDGVTEGGTVRWNGIYTPLFAEEGAYIHGAHGNAQAPFGKNPPALRRALSSLVLAPSLSLSHTLSPSLCHVRRAFSSSSIPSTLPANPHGRLFSVIRTKHPIGRVRSLRVTRASLLFPRRASSSRSSSRSSSDQAKDSAVSAFGPRVSSFRSTLKPADAFDSRRKLEHGRSRVLLGRVKYGTRRRYRGIERNRNDREIQAERTELSSGRSLSPPAFNQNSVTPRSRRFSLGTERSVIRHDRQLVDDRPICQRSRSYIPGASFFILASISIASEEAGSSRRSR